MDSAQAAQAAHWSADLVLRRKGTVSSMIENPEKGGTEVIDGALSPRKRKSDDAENKSPLEASSVVYGEEQVSPKRQRQGRGQISIEKARRVTFAEPEKATSDKGKGRAPDTPARKQSTLVRNDSTKRDLTHLDISRFCIRQVVSPSMFHLNNGPLDSAQEMSFADTLPSIKIITSPSMLDENMRNFDFDSFVDNLSSTSPFSKFDAKSSSKRLEESRQTKEEQMVEHSKTTHKLEDLYPNLKEWLAEHCTELDNIIEQTQQTVGIIQGGKELIEGDFTPELATKLEHMIREVTEQQAEVLPSLALTLRSASEGNYGLSSDSGNASNQDLIGGSSSNSKQEASEYRDGETQTDSSDHLKSDSSRDSSVSEDLFSSSSGSNHYSQDAISSKWNVNNSFTDQYLALVTPLWSSVLDSIGTSKGFAELENLKSLGHRFTREECRLVNTAHHLHVRYLEHRENILLALEDPDIVSDVLKEEEILLQVLEILKYEVSACYEGEKKADKSINF
ncbi:hypothetical protein ACMFMG_010832 [Clarireedia jacksonii]